MPNNHGFCNTMHVTAMNVDAYKGVGIAATDIDNGVCVVLGDINKTSSGNVMGFEYTVTPADASSTSVWLVRSPEVGTTLEMQLMSDPRYFYNEAGEPMSLCYMNPKVDVIEVNKEAFVTGSDPDTVTGATYVTIGAGGKYVAQTTEPTGTATYFSIVGTHTVPIGQELMKTWMLRCERN